MTEADDRRFISLFSGAGGLDTGLEEAGWQLLGQVEMDKDAAQTLRLAEASRHRPDRAQAVVFEDRIEDVDPTWLREHFGLEVGELPLLAGGPPCQPFTTHGLRLSIEDSRASGVWPTYLQYVDAFMPRSLLIENVDGLLSAALQHRPLALRHKTHGALSADEKKGSFLLWLVTALAKRGYTVSWGLAEAADYGVSQFRQRAILVGVREINPFFLPAPYYDGKSMPYKTLKDALGPVTELGAVQPLSERKRRVYDLVPAGGNWRDLPIALQASTMGAAHSATGGKSGWWRRLQWDAPSPTILGMPDHSSTALVHPDETRCLSVNECAAVQSFPTETCFAGNGRSQYQQIGNAVPPLLAKAVGQHLSTFLSGTRHEQPVPPDWRKTSANRRIGTHGWVVPGSGRGAVTLLAKVRPDHVWSQMEERSVDL